VLFRSLPKNFSCRGWLDNQTVIGLVTNSTTPTIGVVNLRAPGGVENWGVTGEFVGVLDL
jgi:hypothetical protein